ncbi:MAG: type II toxin-antitoxin system RelE/ParE family toxin [Candidatus Macondimonas sp.]
MTYALHIKRSAVKALQSIARDERLRLIEAIDRLVDNPGAGSVLKGEFSGLRRLRVGNYRIVYEVQAQQLVVLVVRIGRRRDISR